MALQTTLGCVVTWGTGIYNGAEEVSVLLPGDQFYSFTSLRVPGVPIRSSPSRRQPAALFYQRQSVCSVREADSVQFGGSFCSFMVGVGV